jgi:tetratricopeptide (TPR) repeat protein
LSDWLGPVLALVAGLVAGAAIWRRQRGRTLGPPSGEESGRDLEARRDSLLARLRELDPSVDADERLALELDAARAWRALDQQAPASAPPPGSAARAADSGRRGFLWGAGSAAVVAALLFFVSRSTGERQESGSLTGNTPSAGARDVEPEQARLEEAVRRSPDDLEARMALAQAALGRQDMMQVFEQTRYVLDRSPGHPRALSYQALVRLAMGQPDVAVRMLNQALATDPSLLEGYLHLALVQARLGNAREGEEAIAEASRRYPDEAPRLRALWQQMQQTGPEKGDAATADAHAPPGPDAAAGGTEVAGSAGVAGTVELAAGGAAAPRPGAILFITVREEGVRQGPPVAAKRLPVGAWPVAFRIGPEDSMMGAEFPARVRIEARVDSDGDPLTRDAADPSASQDQVARGRSDVRLVLTR